MRSGRLHVAGLASGETGFAVNLTGAVPAVLIKGNKDGPTVSSGGGGKKTARSKPSPISGQEGRAHLALFQLWPSGPVGLVSERGITPRQDYNIVFSGKHDGHSPACWNDYDAAPSPATSMTVG